MMALAAGGAGLAGSGTLTALQLATSAAAPILGGMAERSQAKTLQAQAEKNAIIGQARAAQADTVNIQEMDSELGSARAALSANAQDPSVGTFEMLQAIRDTRNRERRIEHSAYMQQVEDYRTQAANYGQQARTAIPMGLVRAGPSLFDLYQTLR